jgi:pSer/pThr/pTyr-binding forkhead associated (FHA) protein
MKLQLVVLTPGKWENKVIPITLSQFLIGRDPQCHLRPASVLISKRHCALLVREGNVFLRDFDSTNGTFVNDQQIKGEVELHAEDRLKVGPLLFALKVEVPTAVDKPTPVPPTKTPAPPTKAPAATKTPPPPTKAPAPKPPEPAAKEPAAKPAVTKVPEDAADDDSIAAMLLSLQDDGEPSAASTGSSEMIPDGSTVMDIQSPFPTEEGASAPNKDKKPAKPAPGNTSTAAKAILEKYMRRPRT